ncbi:MAG TPA: tol-pal system-associated acyl-CoA thioesterase [Sutterella sp.]|nr:tol-pal system-associated acyl-CoA thioesterase [Sutterella sp.]
MKIFKIPVRIYFEDTDTGGVVYHANYLRYFERGRTEYLRACGLEQYDMIASGRFVFVVSDITIAYKRPAKLDDLLEIRTSVEKMGRASFIFNQSAWRGDDLICQASVRVASVTPEGRPVAMPEEWTTRLQASLANNE